MYRGSAPRSAPTSNWRDEDEQLLHWLRARRIAMACVRDWLRPHAHLHEAPVDPVALERHIDGLASLVATAEEDALQRAERGESALLERYLDGMGAHRLALALDWLADLALGEPAAAELALRLRVRALRAWRASNGALQRTAATLAPELSSEERQASSDDAAMASLDECAESHALHVVAVDAGLAIDENAGDDWLAGRVHAAMRVAVRTHLQGARLRLGALGAESAGESHVLAFGELARDVQSLHDARRGARSGPDLDVRFVLDVDGPLLSSCVELAWKLYHAKENTLLRRLISSLRPAMLRVAQVVQGGELAYASRVAQLHVFDAETEEALDAQFLAVETALLLCPTHRNARVVAADLHAHRGHLWLRGGNADKAREEAEKARALWPDNRRLATLDAALAGR